MTETLIYAVISVLSVEAVVAIIKRIVKSRREKCEHADRLDSLSGERAKFRRIENRAINYRNCCKASCRSSGTGEILFAGRTRSEVRDVIRMMDGLGKYLEGQDTMFTDWLEADIYSTAIFEEIKRVAAAQGERLDNEILEYKFQNGL